MHFHVIELEFREVPEGGAGGASAFILMSISSICELGAILSTADARKFRFISTEEIDIHVI